MYGTPDLVAYFNILLATRNNCIVLLYPTKYSIPQSSAVIYHYVTRGTLTHQWYVVCKYTNIPLCGTLIHHYVTSNTTCSVARYIGERARETMWTCMYHPPRSITRTLASARISASESVQVLAHARAYPQARASTGTRTQAGVGVCSVCVCE